uniref:Mediator of RNA polymerase II transcription subunit 20 n=1 Tax=Ascaris lumbricoides TaxID=6252 RepID=A0A0M3HZ38_ASCLU
MPLFWREDEHLVSTCPAVALINVTDSVLATHDSAIVHLVLKSLGEFGAEIVDIPPLMHQKMANDELQMRRNKLMNICRKMDLLIEGFPAGTLQRNGILLEEIRKSNSTMVTARFVGVLVVLSLTDTGLPKDNLYNSLEGKSHTSPGTLILSGEVFIYSAMHGNLRITTHDFDNDDNYSFQLVITVMVTTQLRAMTADVLSFIAMALFDAQRSGLGAVSRFYKGSDGKWLFIGVNDKHSLFSLFKQLQIDKQLEHDASDEKISAALAERLKQQPQSYWTSKITGHSFMQIF